MDDLERSNAELKEEVNQLKEQMSKLMEFIQEAAKKDNETPSSTPDNPPGFSLAHAQGVVMPLTVQSNRPFQQVSQPHDVQFPPYGLPPGYAPPFVVDPTDSNPPATAQLGLTQSQGPLNNAMRVPYANVPPYVVPPKQVPLPNTSQQDMTHVYYPPHSLTVPVPNYSPEVDQQHPISPTPRAVEDDQPKGRLQLLEERMRAMEGGNHGFSDASGLCLVPDIVIPPKFKVPEFHKYKGTTCPKSHLTMYCRKMASHTHDEKMLIHFFQGSLAGGALNWYMHLERIRIRNWGDLADAFLKQYKYNADMAPDRMQLQNTLKKGSETFKEYAQRWRELASQVEPPLSEKEIVSMFIETLQSPFYDRMVESVSSNFSDMVIIGERVEHGMRIGRIPANHSATSNMKKPAQNFGKNNEGEANAVTTYQTSQWHQPTPPQSSNIIHPHQNSPQDQDPKSTNNQRNKDRVQFDPIPMTYTELLPQLIKGSLVVPYPLVSSQPPYPRGYDPNAKCDYHAGSIEHSTEKCLAFKHKVQKLIDAKLLNFAEKPNIGNNSLPGHSVNAIGEDSEPRLVRSVGDIRTPLKLVYIEMCKRGMIKGSLDEVQMCGFHPGAPHHIQECNEFRGILQDLMDQKLVRIGQSGADHEVAMNKGQIPIFSKPLVIHYTRSVTTPSSGGPKTIIVQVDKTSKARLQEMFVGSYGAALVSTDPKSITIKLPIPFPFKDSKAVQWKCDFKIENVSSEAPTITNIGDTMGVTKRGHVYTLEDSLETSFRALEIASATYVNKEMPDLKAQSSDAPLMVAKVMLEGGYEQGRGLGTSEKGIVEVPTPFENKDKYGLGYKPTKDDKKMVAADKREKRLARLENQEPKTKRLTVCNLSEKFRSAGFELLGPIAAAEEDIPGIQHADLIRPCAPNENLNNWKVVRLAMVYKFVSK
ncbi:uncharacterized protein LOC130744214 [Lotus japonicus]|uniref:uncharacterized protein LOC130744214 n=1 Tax=Lotus japonicus TaxID=34305 RepID=UPI002589C2A9|nr:uncharacterized protein LOC130744214 [Lotus japonicus]